MGRSDEAVREARKALELDPLTPSTNVDLGWVLFFARRYDESIAQLKKVLELNPNFAWAYTELSWNYAQKRMYPEAVAACRKAAGLAPQDQEQLADWGLVYGLAGRRQEAYEILDQLRKTPGYLDPYGMASVYGGIGDKDRAVEWLERAYRERSPSMWGLKMDVKMDEWWTDALRSDPRFQALLHKMNFPEK
jgi:serine/threonine-protein kinase